MGDSRDKKFPYLNWDEGDQPSSDAKKNDNGWHKSALGGSMAAVVLRLMDISVSKYGIPKVQFYHTS